MKKFIAGFLVGAILFSLAPVSAAIEEFICYKADYKTIVNGAEYNDTNHPILNHKGSTYYPKEVLEKAGLNVAWNAELSQAEVALNPTSTQINDVEGITMSTTATTIEYDPVTGLPVGAEYVENTKDNQPYKTIAYNGEIYISMIDLKNLFGIDNKYIDGLGVCFYKDGALLPVSSKDKSNHFFVSSRLYYNLSLFESYMGE